MQLKTPRCPAILCRPSLLQDHGWDWAAKVMRLNELVSKKGAKPAFWSSWLAQLHQARSIKLRKVFESKTITYLTQVWWKYIRNQYSRWANATIPARLCRRGSQSCPGTCGIPVPLSTPHSGISGGTWRCTPLSGRQSWSLRRPSCRASGTPAWSLPFWR